MLIDFDVFQGDVGYPIKKNREPENLHSQGVLFLQRLDRFQSRVREFLADDGRL